MNWEQWIAENRKRIEHVVGYEENFVKSILAKISGISPEDVTAKFHFTDSNGSNRYIDFMIVNEAKGYRLPIELDGYRKVTNYHDFNDMLFVAPYNHQVSKLKNILGKQAKVGSLDKFQGQESPVVFLSMCASDANESPRGMDFLFDKNRINVAISRAQTLAIVVANPNLGNTSVNSVEQLRKVNLFNAVMYMSSDTKATYTEQAIFLY